jgi:hypothetical protein
MLILQEFNLGAATMPLNFDPKEEEAVKAFEGT